MTKQEFLDTLGRSLRRELSEAEAAENLRYYETYISQQVSSGKSEAQVLAELGDPRLIARTILQVDQQREEASSGRAAESVYTEDSDGTFREEKTERGAQERTSGKAISVSRIKGWAVIALVVVVLLILLRTAFAIFVKLLPILLVLAGLTWLYRKFHS